MQIRIYALKFGILYLSNSMRIVVPPYLLSMWTPEWDLSGSPPLSSRRMDLLTATHFKLRHDVFSLFEKINELSGKNYQSPHQW